MNRNRIRAFALLVAAASLLLNLPASAQDDLEEIVVTGSYIARPADRPQPVQVLDAQELLDEQKNSFAEVFKDMTITNGSIALLNTENGTSPTTSINLRGVGPRGTLVLLNGKRQTVDGSTGGGGTVAVDINNLTPSIMVERVEILTDGASALYGSDAVAGVVNLITRDNFEGAEVAVRGLNTDRSGTSEFTVSGVFGAQGENTSVVAGFDYTDRDLLDVEQLFDEDRLLISIQSSFGNPGSLQPPSAMGAGGRFPDPLCGSEELGGGLRAGIPVTGMGPGRCGLLLSFGRNIVSETERLVGLATIDHTFDDNLRAEVEMGFAQGRFARHSGYGFPISGPRPVVPATNPGIIAENARSGLPIRDYALWYRMGSPIQEAVTNLSTQDTYRLTGSLIGDINDNWQWSAITTWSENDTVVIQGDTLADRLKLALNCQGLATRDACWNPLGNAHLASPGDPHYNNPALFKWIFAERINSGNAELTTLDLVLTGSLGELPGGPTGIAVGAQVRNQSFTIDWDTLSNDGAFSFFSTPLLDYEGDRDADALFGEVVLFPAEDLEVQLAARFEDYGEVSSTDPKIGVLWTPTDNLFFRATAGTSFRVPGELQIFGATLGRGAQATLGGELIDARAITVGDPNLQPEQADNLTLGFTWDVTDNFTLDVNYWSIDFQNLVVAEDATVLYNQDIADGTFNDPRIVLDPNAGTPACPAPCNVVSELVAQDIVRFELSYINQDYLDTDGVDFDLNWTFESGGNDFGLGFQGTYTLTYDLTSEDRVFRGVGSHNSSNLGAPTPEWMGIARFDWRRGDHYARATLRHIPSLFEDAPAAQGITEEFAYTTLDLLYNYILPGGSGTFTAGVINVADEEIPRKGQTFLTANTLVHDPRGRMFRVGANWGF